MPTLTTLLNEAHTAKDGLFPIIIRIEHRGGRRKLPIGYKIEKKFWRNGSVSTKHPDAAIINAAISSKEAEIKRYLADCQLHGKPIRLDLIGTGRASYSFPEYLDHRAAQYKEAGKIIMNRKVSWFAKEIRRAFGGEVFFDEISLDWIRSFDQALINIGNGENTRHKKFKFLCQYYEHAVREGKASAPNPFKSYKVPVKPVKKDKLTHADISALEKLTLAPGPINNARNLFLFSYYAKGVRFETCVTLRRENIRDGRIHFRANKGNQFLSVKIHERLQAIIYEYPVGDFLFPYVKELPEDPEKYVNMIGSMNTIVNRDLKVVGRLAKTSTMLTMHIARHSFAYHLKGVSDNINVIQDALGHSDQKITQLYLKSLEDEQLDKEMEKLYGM